MKRWVCQMRIPDSMKPAEGEPRPLSIRVKEVQRGLTLRSVLASDSNNEYGIAADLIAELYHALNRAEEERNFYYGLLAQTANCDTCAGYGCHMCRGKSEYRVAQLGDFDFLEDDAK